MIGRGRGGMRLGGRLRGDVFLQQKTWRVIFLFTCCVSDLWSVELMGLALFFFPFFCIGWLGVGDYLLGGKKGGCLVGKRAGVGIGICESWRYLFFSLALSCMYSTLTDRQTDSWVRVVKGDGMGDGWWVVVIDRVESMGYVTLVAVVTGNFGVVGVVVMLCYCVPVYLCPRICRVMIS